LSAKNLIRAGSMVNAARAEWAAKSRHTNNNDNRIDFGKKRDFINTSLNMGTIRIILGFFAHRQARVLNGAEAIRYKRIASQ